MTTQPEPLDSDSSVVAPGVPQFAPGAIMTTGTPDNDDATGVNLNDPAAPLETSSDDAQSVAGPARKRQFRNEIWKNQFELIEKLDTDGLATGKIPDSHIMFTESGGINLESLFYVEYPWWDDSSIKDNIKIDILGYIISANYDLMKSFETDRVRAWKRGDKKLSGWIEVQTPEQFWNILSLYYTSEDEVEYFGRAERREDDEVSGNDGEEDYSCEEEDESWRASVKSDIY